VPVALAPVAQYDVSALELILNGDFSNQLYFWILADAQTKATTSELRAGGRALLVNTWAGQKLATNALQAGKSYVLTVTARKSADTGTASMSVVFHDRNSVTYRDFKRAFTSGSYAQYSLRFTAPAYVGNAEVSFSVSGAQAVIDSVSLKMQAPIVQTEPVASLEGSFAPSGYGLAFNDEFNGSTLNTDKWFTRYIYNGGTLDRLNDEQQRYRENGNHVVSNGVLNLVARKVSSGDPQGIDYESGMIRSDWTTRYGYIEARVKMPGAVGVWPAFWLNSDVSETGKLTWPPEIDIFEYVNNGVEDRVNMLHTGVVDLPGVSPTFLFLDSAFNSQWTFWYAPFNFNEGWHTVAAEWTPTTVTTYVDGRKIMSRAYQWKDSDGEMAGPAHILLNLAIGGNWAGRYGIDAAAFPQSFQIDWVRAYAKLD
jgi:beta-glucanase (GH16 family)